MSPMSDKSKCLICKDFAPRAGQSVADPYYGAEDGFAATWDDVSAVAAALVATYGSSE